MKKQIKNKKITINNLAVMMTEGFDNQEKKTDKKIENLAVMVKKGFDDAKTELGGQINRVEEKFDRKFITIDNHLDGIDKKVSEIGKDIEIIKTDIEFIKSGLKKKVDYEEFAALERRMVLLESKIKSSHV